MRIASRVIIYRTDSRIKFYYSFIFALFCCGHCLESVDRSSIQVDIEFIQPIEGSLVPAVTFLLRASFRQVAGDFSLHLCVLPSILVDGEEIMHGEWSNVTSSRSTIDLLLPGLDVGEHLIQIVLWEECTHPERFPVAVAGIGVRAVEAQEVFEHGAQARIIEENLESASLLGCALRNRSGVDACAADPPGPQHAAPCRIRADGAPAWKQAAFEGRRLSTPAAAGNEVVVCDLEGYVHFLDRDTGAVIARGSTDGYPVDVPPLPIPGGVLIQTRDGTLAAFSIAR